jgi:hypothetical protein
MLSAIAIFILLGIVLVIPTLVVGDLAENHRNLLRKTFNLLIAAWCAYWVIVFISGADRTPTLDVKRGGIVAATEIAIGLICAWVFQESLSNRNQPEQFDAQFPHTLKNGNALSVYMTFELPKRRNTVQNQARIITAIKAGFFRYFRTLDAIPEEARIEAVAKNSVAGLLTKIRIPASTYSAVITNVIDLERGKSKTNSTGDIELEPDDSR